MSLKRTAYHFVAIANNALCGARKTKSARTSAGRQFIDFCLMSGQPINDIRHATAEQLKQWVGHLRLSGIKAATITNKVACVRALIGARGVDLVMTGIGNSAALGLEKRDRSGTKLPISDEKFESAKAKAQELNEVGFVCVIELERYLGVRGLEALMSTHQLRIYAKEAKAMLQEAKEDFYVEDGTKGGRPRWVQPLRAYAAETFAAIQAAVEFAESNGGHLIEGPLGTGLKGARAKYHRLAALCGLTGKYAPHSLRYRYATDKLVELYATGMPLKEALRAVSKSLGHGFARNTFIRKVYAASVIGSMPATTSKQDIAALLVDLKAMMPELKLKKDEL